jgi:hypothetical protein
MLNIEKMYDEWLESNIKQYPARSNYISIIGDPCLRKLVYNRTAYEEKTPISIRTKKIFDEGIEQEKYFIPRIRKALNAQGYDIVCEQKIVEIKKYNLSGRIDGEIVSNNRENKERYPIEFKTCSPHTFDSYNNIEDFDKNSWSKKYAAQLLLYMYITDAETGCFILKNKSNGEIKCIWLNLLDYLGYCETILKKAEEIETHIKNETLPEKYIVYENCRFCDFKHICMPDIDGGEYNIIEDKAIEEKINRYMEIKKIKQEYDKIDRELKIQLNGKNNLIIGNWEIIGKKICKKIPESKTKEIVYWKREIKPIE